MSSDNPESIPTDRMATAPRDDYSTGSPEIRLAEAKKQLVIACRQLPDGIEAKTRTLEAYQSLAGAIERLEERNQPVPDVETGDLE